MSEIFSTVEGVIWDDLYDFRTPVARNLRRHGMKTYASGEAKSVVTVAKKQGLDFAIVDLVDERHGTEVTGLNTIREIRSTSSRCLIVALTGHAKFLTEKIGPHFVNVATAAGADLVLDKGNLGVLKDTMAFARVVWNRLIVKKVVQIRTENPRLDSRSIVAGLVLGLRCEEYVDLTVVYEQLADTEVGSSSINSQNYSASKRERANLLSGQQIIGLQDDECQPAHGFQFKPKTSKPSALVQFFSKLLEIWDLDVDSVCPLLGYEQSSKSHVRAILSGAAPLETRDEKDRIAELFVIRKILHSVFRDKKVENQWLREPQSLLDGSSPLELLLEGSWLNLLRVRQFTELMAGL